METYIMYFIKSSVSLFVFYIVYKAFLSRETYFQLNRKYLLVTMILSVVMPFLNFPAYPVEKSQNMIFILDTITISQSQLQQTDLITFNFINILKYVWITGILIFTIRLFLKLFLLLKLIKRFGIIIMNGSYVVYTDEDYPPFSFFNLIFLNKNMDQNDIEKVVAHEQIHIMQLHSLDILLTELLFIFQWFNPFVLLYKKSLRETHEFLADHAVISEGYDKIGYQQLILSMSFNVRISDLTNNFNASQIKRRIIMMTKMKSGFTAKVKFFLIVPIIVCVVALFACNNNEKTIEQEQDTATEAETEVFNEIVDGEIFEVVDVQPEFGNDPGALARFIGENMVYPQEAKEKGIQGKVFVSFLVTKTGKISNAEILKSDNELFNAEALRVVRLMPDWKPGKVDGENVHVKFVLPIQFSLN